MGWEGSHTCTYVHVRTLYIPSFVHVAEPEVITVDVTANHEFIVLACDGEYLKFSAVKY